MGPGPHYLSHANLTSFLFETVPPLAKPPLSSSGRDVSQRFTFSVSKSESVKGDALLVPFSELANRNHSGLDVTTISAGIMSVCEQRP
jgi:hypothetical protein